MKTILKTGFIILMLLAAGAKLTAQVVTIDSSKVRVEQKTTAVDPEQKGAKPDAAQQAQQARKGPDNNPSKAVKQVKGGRPDLSKARGARPPVIVRPAGTTIPKGVGKPAGVGKKGGR